MKNLTYYKYIVFCLTFGCQLVEKPTYPGFVGKTNWRQVQIIAQKNGIADSITLENSAGLMYLDTLELSQYMGQRAKDIKKQEQLMVYVCKLKEINSLEEYWDLVDSLPLVKRFRYETENTYRSERMNFENPAINVYIKNGDKPYIIAVPKISDEGQPDARLLPKHPGGK